MEFFIIPSIFYYFFKIKKKQTKKMIKDEMEAYLKFIKYMN